MPLLITYSPRGFLNDCVTGPVYISVTRHFLGANSDRIPHQRCRRAGQQYPSARTLLAHGDKLMMPISHNYGQQPWKAERSLFGSRLTRLLGTLRHISRLALPRQPADGCQVGTDRVAPRNARPDACRARINASKDLQLSSSRCVS